ncbi:B3 domain-containing protein [Drosera capensis]
MSARQKLGKTSEKEAANVSTPMDVEPSFIEPDIEPLTGKPFAHLIMSKSHVKYYMSIPMKLAKLLASAVVPVELIRGGMSWKMTYEGEDFKNSRRLDAGWKTFVNDNRIEAGDACVLELLESSSELIKFKVQILRCKFPDKLLERISGDTMDSPILIDD